MYMHNKKSQHEILKIKATFKSIIKWNKNNNYLTFSVLFIVPTQIYKERVDASKLMKSNLKVVKGMMNKTELDYAAMGILF